MAAPRSRLRPSERTTLDPFEALALGTATEIRDARNYAGHRMAPWLGHLMVSRQETARPLLTPGEVMQLPPSDALVLVSGLSPIRAKKARYFEDPQLARRVLPPPPTVNAKQRPTARDWNMPVLNEPAVVGDRCSTDSDGGIRREPAMPGHEEVSPPVFVTENEFEPIERDPADDAIRARALNAQQRSLARQASLDPGDDLGFY